MSGTTSGNLYAINGVISTDKTVLQNLETLASAAGCFLSYDIHDARWSVIINRAGNSIAQFNDSNIIGPISVGSTGLTELYNSVKLEFPHIDLRDNLDYVTLTIPAADRNSNEPDNELNIQFDCINNPVQAEYLAFLELKQNRLDTVVSFTTDFSYLNLKAGDIIDITNSVYGYTNKMFRIITIVENDNDDGSITLDITALEYDVNIYSTADLYRYARSDSTGITTFGAIGAPGTPTVNKFEVSSRPRILVESTAPIGTVSGMEFWYSDTNALLDENRVYNLLGTTTPTVGNVFTFGSEVTFEYAGTLANVFYVKTRGINSQTAGLFSNVTTTSYAPVQVPDALSDNTEVLDDAGDNILTSLGVSALLALLNGLFQGNTGIGASWGNALGTSQAGVSSIIAGNNISITSSTGAVTISSTGGGGGGGAVNSIVAGTGITVSSPTGNVTVSSTQLWQGASRYVQSTAPTAGLVNGDVWFKIP